MKLSELLPLFFLALFYLFFFYRNLTLRFRAGTAVKAPGLLVNLSILVSGLSSAAFLLPFFLDRPPGLFRPLAASRGLSVTGTVLMGFGVIGSILGSLSLRGSWRVGIPENEETELVTGGMFRFSRNPYFTSFFFVFIGQSLVVPSVPVLGASAVGMVLFHLMVLREERHLERLHGEDYREYRRRVARYLPLSGRGKGGREAV